MADELSGRTVAFLMANAGVEQVELTGPRDALTQAGARVVLLAPEQGTIQAFTNDVEKADAFEADLAVADALDARRDHLDVVVAVRPVVALDTPEVARDQVRVVHVAHALDPKQRAWRRSRQPG